MINITDDQGKRFTVPRPELICPACLRDRGCWCIRSPVIGVYCEHRKAGAIWRSDDARWFVVMPVEQETFTAGLAAAVARWAIHDAKREKVRH